MTPFAYTIHLEPLEEGGYFVSVPALPGCCTQGETYEEALEMAGDAITLWLEALAIQGKPIPHEPESQQAFTARISVNPAIKIS